MYRDANLRQYQYFVLPDWAGGVYASPAVAGSRSVLRLHFHIPAADLAFALALVPS